MKKVSLTLLLILFLSGLSLAGEYTAQEFNKKFSTLEDETQIANLCKDYMANATDIDLIRNVQSQWENVDPDAVRQFSKELYEKNPNSEKYAYLYGRVVESPVEQIKLGRKAIQLSMMWPYGYRLVLATYMSRLFNADPSDEYVSELKNMLPEDAKLFKTLIKLEPKEDYPLQFFYSYQKYNKDYDGALETLEKGKAMNARWASPVEYASIHASQGKYEDALSEIGSFIDMQGVTGDDRQMYIDYYYKNILIDAGAYQKAIDYYKAKADYGEKPETVYDVACIYSLMGDKDNAAKALMAAADKGFDKANQAQNDTDLTALHDDSRWAGIIAKIQKNWDNGKEGRKKEALAKKISQKAPDWKLEDKDGNIVSLADLRGNVLVLDFWATWCGPCRMAMPVIDEFVKKHAPDGVKVFSINVWEQGGKKKALKFMQDKEYAMTLLYGTNQLTQAYGIKGIPFICVIDKDGNICYQESGYSEGLSENLIWWTEDLL